MATAVSDQAGAGGPSRRDSLYAELSAAHGPALERLARAYETDRDRQLDLLQEMHVSLWRSLEHFDGRCSPRTWVYRVAHNVAVSHVIHDRRSRAVRGVSLSELEERGATGAAGPALEGRQALDRLFDLISRLNPVDRQVITLYLEELDAATIAEITGLSAANVATKVHRIRNLLARRFHTGGSHE